MSYNDSYQRALANAVTENDPDKSAVSVKTHQSGHADTFFLISRSLVLSFMHTDLLH